MGTKNTFMGKIKLFIMSFWIFFLLLFAITIDMPIRGYFSSKWIDILSVNNFIACVSLLFLLLGALFYYQFMHKLKGSLELPITIKRIENINYEYFSLLVTIISLIAFDFSTIRGLVLLCILLFILCAIFIKTELFYSNPSFALLGFHIYKIDSNGEGFTNKIFITKNKLKVGEKVKYMRISENVYFSQKV